MKREISVVLACMTALCGCVQNAPEEAVSQSVSETYVCETEIAEEITHISESDRETVSESESRTTTDTSAPTETEESSSLSEDVLSQTEISSDTVSISESRELLSEETTAALSESVIIEETAPPLTELQPEATPAKVDVPEIPSGSFTGENVLENEYAYVDCSDASDGVIFVKFKTGSEGAMTRITTAGGVYDYTLDKDGSVLPLQMGNGTYNIKVLQKVSGREFAIAYDGDFDVNLKDEFRPYLMPTQYINYDSSSECVYTAAQLCYGKRSDPEKINAMFGYITERISYDKELARSVKSGYVPDPDRTLETGKGICFDYASLFAAMCRSQNIPARLVMGYVSGNLYHAWNEVYTEETGWVKTDLFLDKGWNLLDPTFYASAETKQDAVEFIGNGSNYSAVYYY
ncbi:MAG: transglutaminase family protein [Huintestinicola sp.]